jgi:hypothetical protein
MALQPAPDAGLSTHRMAISDECEAAGAEELDGELLDADATSLPAALRQQRVTHRPIRFRQDHLD